MQITAFIYILVKIGCNESDISLYCIQRQARPWGIRKRTYFGLLKSDSKGSYVLKLLKIALKKAWYRLFNRKPFIVLATAKLYSGKEAKEPHWTSIAGQLKSYIQTSCTASIFMIFL